MSKPLISVVVPIYKVETQLRNCLDSILAQTYENLEIILVDDGSPDNCPKICDEYLSKDKRIKVIHKKNGGLSDARNAGIEIATGEYIGFIDSDDWVAPDMYQYLYEGFLKYDCDVAICEYFNVGPTAMTATRRKEVRIFDGDEILNALLSLKIGNYAWNKLYKRTLWKDIRYPVGKNYEDVLTTYRIFLNCKRVISLPDVKYYYLTNESGIVKNPSLKNKLACCSARIERREILKNKKLINKLTADTKNFMLKEIGNYAFNLREVGLSSFLKTFGKNKSFVVTIQKFLKENFSAISRQMKLGRIKKIILKFLTRKNILSWFAAYFLLKTIDFLKKYKIKNRIVRRKNKSILNNYYRLIDFGKIKKNWVVLESRGGDDLAGNIFYLLKELLTRKDLKIFLVAKKKSEDKIKKILKMLGTSDVNIIHKLSNQYYKVFAQAHYFFSDMCYESMIVKKEGQIWINLWHGTPLKCLEYDVADQRHEVGGATREFLRTDFLVVPNKFFLEKMTSCTNINKLLNSYKYFATGYPRNQIFFDKQKSVENRDRYGLAEKEVFVYMPTWRGTLNNKEVMDGNYAIPKILEFFESNLKENQIMFVKLHNFDNAEINYSNYKKIKPFPGEIESYEFLSVADCLITDYSSVFFDFANTGKKIVLFSYDREVYMQNHGMYLDFESLPFNKVDDYDQLKKCLNVIKDYDDSDFIKEYCTYDNPESAKKLVEAVFEYNCKDYQVVNFEPKKKILVVDTNYSRRDYSSDDVVKFFDGKNLDDSSYFYGYEQNKMKKQPKVFSQLSEKISLFGFAGNYYPDGNSVEWKKAGRSSLKREYLRSFQNSKFDEIIYLGNNDCNMYFNVLKKHK